MQLSRGSTKTPGMIAIYVALIAKYAVSLRFFLISIYAVRTWWLNDLNYLLIAHYLPVDFLPIQICVWSSWSTLWFRHYCSNISQSYPGYSNHSLSLTLTTIITQLHLAQCKDLKLPASSTYGKDSHRLQRAGIFKHNSESIQLYYILLNPSTSNTSFIGTAIQQTVHLHINTSFNTSCHKSNTSSTSFNKLQYIVPV